MQINPSQQNSAEVIRDVPARLLASLAEGERVQATVIAKLGAQSVKLQVADTVLQLISQQPLQAGQKIELQRSVEAGRAVLKIVAADTALNVERPATLNASLKPGQQLAVEVIKLLAQNRLLVSPSLINDSRAQTTQASSQTAISQTLPRQIEVDISALKQSFKPGDKLALEVIQAQPLAIKIRPDSPSRAALIQNYQRSLLPQIDNTPTPLATLNKPLAESVLPQPIRQEITRLFQGLTDKAALQRPDALQQTINRSGVFLESLIKNNPASVATGQDFKANLLQLAQVLKQQLQQPLLYRVIDNPEVMKKLPVEVQTALRQLATAPQDLRPLPAQVPPALASKGQTPMQLLFGLLSGLRSAVATAENPLAPPSFTASTTQGQNLSGVQAFINARESQALQTQNAVRFVEWQMMRDMLREVESASARIQFNQLSMVRDPDTSNNVNVWLFDLPVKDKQQLEMLQLRLEQHSPDLTRGDESIWQVQLNLETQNLGPMQARISLHQQDVKVVILAERAQSAEMLSRYIDDLNTRLQKLEISISHLSCRQAVIKPLTTEIQPGQTGERLLDISV